MAAEERPAFIQFAQGRLSMDEAGHTLGKTLHAPSIHAHPTNLVAPLTELIGREHELEKLNKLLLHDRARLFTLTGPPGIGKTRLSLQSGIELLEHFRDGVFFVGLATLVDPDLVLATIAQTLGVYEKSAASLLGKLQGALSNRHMLILLDNFEQVLDASPTVVDLLGACPHLKILITSREALHIYGEHQFHVPPLANADPAHLPTIEVIEKIPAVALFTERARAVDPNFLLTDQNAASVASICTRLDGLPLAIELAAAHIRLLSPQEMEVRLDKRLPLLTGGPRNLPARQRTLRAAIDWSYNLLTEAEQTLFARLSVFVGGCTLSAATAVCNGAISPQLTRETRHPAPLQIDISEGIEFLLDKNLLKREDGRGVGIESQFTMLELIREYALDRLRASGEEEEIRRLHAEYYVAFVESANKELIDFQFETLAG